MCRRAACLTAVALAIEAVAAPARAEPARMMVVQHGDKLSFRALPPAGAPLAAASPTAPARRARPPNRVYVVFNTLGATATAPFACQDLVQPGFLRARGRQIVSNRQSLELEGAGLMRDAFKELLRKGYRLVFLENPRPDEVVKAVGDPRTTAVFHEGHSGYTPEGELRLGFLQQGQKHALDGRFVPPGFRASPQLKLFVTNACMGARLEPFYSRLLGLGRGTAWVGGSGSEVEKTIRDRYWLGGPVWKQLRGLPDLSGPASSSRR